MSKGENMKKLLSRTKRLVIVTVLASMAMLGAAQAASATTQYYNFDKNVPTTGWVYSSTKTLPAGINFDARLDYCSSNDGSSQGSLGVLFKPVNASNLTALAPYTKLLPGSARTTLLQKASYTRSIKIGLQAVGTQYVTARGYWFY
ncbi:MAG: hypothetical protein IBX64_10720 [Actinobacteria bacterium]|nr:hypothetical protein [Actinomycetota bacterium]